MEKLKTILLTGATGFLGSYLLEALLYKGHKVVILKRSTSDLWRIEGLLEQCVSYDVDTQPVELAFEEQRIDVVIHTACHYGRNADSTTQVVESNLLFGLRVLDACLKFSANTFINTDTLLSRHQNIYTLSKKQFVEWLNKTSEKIQVVNLKLEHMYGPKDDSTKLVPWFFSQLKVSVPEIKLTLGEQKRDFIYIDDVVSAYMIVLNKLSDLEKFSEFDVGTGQLLMVRSFLKKLKKAYEERFGPTNTNLAFGAIPYREGELMTVEIDNNRLLELGWVPETGLSRGLITTVKDII